jgi:hypothetical protein
MIGKAMLGRLILLIANATRVIGIAIEPEFSQRRHDMRIVYDDVM